jgi:predicted transcriptional regulator
VEENMNNITITLPDDSMARLKEVAAGLGTSPEELVRASVEDLLGRPEEEFQRAADYVLKKNEVLYRRLA